MMAISPKPQNCTGDPSLKILQSIEEQLRLLVRLQLAPMYESLVASSGLQPLYMATGEKSISTLAKEFGMSTGKISMLWQKWEKAGLLVKRGQHYEQTM